MKAKRLGSMLISSSVPIFAAGMAEPGLTRQTQDHARKLVRLSNLVT